MHQSYPHEHDIDRRSSLTAALGSSLSLEVPVWLASMFIHMALILWLGSAGCPRCRGLRSRKSWRRSLLSKRSEAARVAQAKVLTSAQVSWPNVGSARVAGMEVEVSTALKVTETVELPRLPPQSKMLTDLRVPLIQDLISAPQRGSKAQIKGVAGDGATGTLGALDRITQEILLSLERGRRWSSGFFDSRAVCKFNARPCAPVRQHLPRTRAQHGRRCEARRSEALLSSIVAFGKDITFRTERPTDDLEVLKKAIDGIENDDSGVEMTFTAIGTAAEKYQSLRMHKPSRRVMMVVFTDEVARTRTAARSASRFASETRCRCMSSACPRRSGGRTSRSSYVDPDPAYDQSVQWIPVRQGPETFLPEQVLLNFSGKTDREDGLYRLDSGFGPYCLTRLAWKPAAIFFAVHGNRERIADHVTAPRDAGFSGPLELLL